MDRTAIAAGASTGALVLVTVAALTDPVVSYAAAAPVGGFVGGALSDSFRREVIDATAANVLGLYAGQAAVMVVVGRVSPGVAWLELSGLAPDALFVIFLGYAIVLTPIFGFAGAVGGLLGKRSRAVARAMAHRYGRWT